MDAAGRTGEDYLLTVCETGSIRAKDYFSLSDSETHAPYSSIAATGLHSRMHRDTYVGL